MEQRRHRRLLKTLQTTADVLEDLRLRWRRTVVERRGSRLARRGSMNADAQGANTAVRGALREREHKPLCNTRGRWAAAT